MFRYQNIGSGSGSELTKNAGSGSALKPMWIRNTDKRNAELTQCSIYILLSLWCDLEVCEDLWAGVRGGGQVLQQPAQLLPALS